MFARHFLVLLVEDNQDHAEIIKRAFQRYAPHAEVRHVPDGESALDYLNNSGEFADGSLNPRPSIILLDLGLPKLDGFAVLAHTKSSPDLRTIPAVVLTSSDSPQDIRRAYDSHVNSYVVKPSNLASFRQLVTDLQSYWIDWNARAEPQKTGPPCS